MCQLPLSPAEKLLGSPGLFPIARTSFTYFPPPFVIKAPLYLIVRSESETPPTITGTTLAVARGPAGREVH